MTTKLKKAVTKSQSIEDRMNRAQEMQRHQAPAFLATVEQETGANPEWPLACALQEMNY